MDAAAHKVWFPGPGCQRFPALPRERRWSSGTAGQRSDRIGQHASKEALRRCRSPPRDPMSEGIPCRPSCPRPSTATATLRNSVARSATSSSRQGRDTHPAGGPVRQAQPSIAGDACGVDGRGVLAIPASRPTHRRHRRIPPHLDRRRTGDDKPVPRPSRHPHRGGTGAARRRCETGRRAVSGSRAVLAADDARAFARRVP